jgi:hypothetical protein
MMCVLLAGENAGSECVDTEYEAISFSSTRREACGDDLILIFHLESIKWKSRPETSRDVEAEGFFHSNWPSMSH